MSRGERLNTDDTDGADLTNTKMTADHRDKHGFKKSEFLFVVPFDWGGSGLSIWIGSEGAAT